MNWSMAAEVKEFQCELLTQGSDEPDKHLFACEMVRDGFESLESPFTL